MSLFSSILVLLSLAYNFYKNKQFGTEEIKIMGLYAPTIVLSMAGVVTSTCCSWKKVKQWTETVLIFLNLISWIIIGIATLIGTSAFRNLNDLVIDSTSDEFNIGEPNIYFFSFGSLFNAMLLFSSWFKQYILRDENTLTTTQWSLLILSGFMVMATGISKLQEGTCKLENSYSCERTWFSVVIGLISGVAGCFMLPMKMAPLKCQMELAFILVVAWAAAIGVLTFGDGPALYINTMYLGIFFSFFLAMNIFTTSLYADSVLEASPDQNVEFGTTEAHIDDDMLGAAGILDMAYANIARHSTTEGFLRDDPRRFNDSAGFDFDSVGGSVASLDENTSPRSQSGRELHRKVVVGKREFSRVEIWFWLLVESSVSLAVFREELKTCRSFTEQWITLTPALSIGISFAGWFTSSYKRKWAYYLEGSLILICIIFWIIGLIAVTRYFVVNDTAINGTNDTCSYDNEGMTANQLFMSYGAFFTSLYLITEWSDATVTTTDWIFLTATSGTVFGVIFIGHPNVFQRYESAGELQIMLLVLLSLGSACISFLMTLVSFLKCGKMGPIVHVTIGATLLTLWCIGSYFIVFEKEGVGSTIGPTFFACWGSLFFCVDIATTNLVLLFQKKDHVDDEEDLESMSSLHHDEKDEFVDEQKEKPEANPNGKDEEEPFLEPDSGYRTAEEEEILGIVTNGSSSRIEYEEEFQTARDFLPETLQVNTTNL